MLPTSFWPPIASLVYSLSSPLPIAGLYEVFSILHPPACTLFICLILYLSGHSTLNPGSCQAVLCSSDICHIFFFFKKGFTILFTCFWLCGVSTAAWLFSSCAGATLAAVRGFLLAEASPFTDTGFSVCGSLALEHRLSTCGASQHAGSSQTEDCTPVSCLVRQMLCHWVTRETPKFFF